MVKLSPKLQAMAKKVEEYDNKKAKMKAWRKELKEQTKLEKITRFLMMNDQVARGIL